MTILGMLCQQQRGGSGQGGELTSIGLELELHVPRELRAEVELQRVVVDKAGDGIFLSCEDCITFPGAFERIRQLAYLGDH